MTHNTIITTKYVKDWNPKENVSGCEDWSLTNHILDKGLEIYVIPIFTPHKTSFKKIRTNSKWFAKGYINLFGKKQSVVYSLKLLKGIITAIIKILPNWRVKTFRIYQNTYIIKALWSNILK